MKSMRVRGKNNLKAVENSKHERMKGKQELCGEMAKRKKEGKKKGGKEGMDEAKTR